jgi:hypothetical protein
VNRARQSEIAVITGALLAGIFMFAWVVTQADAVPAEYRNTSPGYGWTWDFDWMTALREAGDFGEDPWPWPATATNGQWVLPLGQTLVSGGLEITYRGMSDPGVFRLDIVVRSLDAEVAYPRTIGVRDARSGFMIADRRFQLANITPLYLRLLSDPS